MKILFPRPQCQLTAGRLTPCAGAAIAAAAQKKTTIQIVAGKLSFSKLPPSRLCADTRENNL